MAEPMAVLQRIFKARWKTADSSVPGICPFYHALSTSDFISICFVHLCELFQSLIRSEWDILELHETVKNAGVLRSLQNRGMAALLVLLLRTPHDSSAFIFHDLLYLQSKGMIFSG
jgi:hypothetical protein